MPADNAASAGVISEQAPAESVSTAVEQPNAETQTVSTSITDILRERLPAEVREQLEKIRVPEEQPSEETPAAETEPVVESPETSPEENPSEEQPEAHGDWPDSAKERVAKLTKQKNKAKESIEALEAERDQLLETLEQTQPVTVAPSLSNPLAHVHDEQQLVQVAQEAKFTRDWCRKHPQGVTVDEGKETERFISPEEIADTLGKVEDVLAEAVPFKARQLQERREIDKIARVAHPTIFNKSSEDYQVASALLRQLPSLAEHPAVNLIVGDYIEGVKARLAKGRTNGKTNADIPVELKRSIPPIAPHVPAASRGGNNATPVRKQVNEAMNRVATTGSQEDRIAALQAILKAESQQKDSRSLVSV